MPLLLGAHVTFRVTCHFLGSTLKVPMEIIHGLHVFSHWHFLGNCQKELVFHLVSLTLTLHLTLPRTFPLTLTFAFHLVFLAINLTLTLITPPIVVSGDEPVFLHNIAIGHSFHYDDNCR